MLIREGFFTPLRFVLNDRRKAFVIQTKEESLLKWDANKREILHPAALRSE